MPVTRSATRARHSGRSKQLASSARQPHTHAILAAQVVRPDTHSGISEPPAELPPVILSARPLLGAYPTLAERLREARCELVLAATWERLMVSCEKTLADVILVDYDAVERAYHAGTGRQRISGHRLVSLLARGLAAQTDKRPRALVVLSQMDYAELEDLVHLGIHALERPDQPERLVGRILAAYRRATLNHLSRDGQARQQAVKPAALVTDAAWAVISTALAMAGVTARRARVSDRAVFDGLCSLLQKSAPWRMYPAGCGSVSLARRRLAAWRAAGVFTRLGWAAQSGAHDIEPIMALPWERLVTPAPAPEVAVARAIPAVSYTDWALAAPRA